MIRLLLFISFFLPLAASYSVDSALSENKKNTKNYSSLWSFIFCLQLAAVYLVSFFSKNHPIWNQEYSAIYYALHLEMFVTHFGLWLGQFKVFGQWLTYLVYYAELIGGTLVILSLFLGRYAQPVRLVASLALIIFHLGLILTMKLGTFPYVMIAAWLVFIPSSFWDFLFKKLELVKKFQLQIFYDGECSFCKKTVFMLKTFFLLPSVRARECQSQEEVLQLMTKENSWVVINHKNEKLTKLDAMIAFWRASPILSPFTFLISNPLFYVLGTKAYVWVSYNRKIMGKITSIFHWKKEFEFRKYKIFSLVMGVVYLICTYQWNMLEVNSKYSLLRYVNAREVTRYLQLFQNWKMFSPYPQTNTAWFVFQGHFKDKKVWDLVRNQAVSFEKPQKLLSEEFSSKFWRKYFNNMERDPKLARYLSLYLCRENLGNLVEIKVYKLSQNNNFMNGAEPISETMILSQKCP